MGTSQATVLIVDDEELNCDGLARRLQRQDYVVATARNGREAIEFLGGGKFDLVLLDIMMPGMNGLEVLKFLRRVDTLVDLPIIMVTANGESEDMVEAFELGANDYVTKPLDFPVVLARIRTQLALRHAIARVKELEGKLAAENRSLREATENLTAVNDRYRRDLESAARLQRAFQSAVPQEIPGIGLAWAFEPCSQLAGDYVNVFRLGDRHAGLCVLDAGGNGVTAALLSVAASQILARVAGGAGSPVSPSGVASLLARELATEANTGQTVSLLYGVLALETGEFRFVSAGNPGPVHLTEGKPPVKLDVTGFPVGISDRTYKEQVLALKAGDRLVLHSDGLTDVRNAEGEHFGDRRLLGVLDATRNLAPKDVLDGLVGKIKDWSGEQPWQDDISILLVERPEATP